MSTHLGKGQRVLELFLILIAAGLTALLYTMAEHKLIVLNLYFLPIVLAGFFLGRYRAGVLALFCFIAVSVVTTMNLREFVGFNSPVVVGLGVIVWGAVLGLTAIMVGTLSDERNLKLIELHEAHVGVVEVLARYLQRANSNMKAQSHRVAELSQLVARQMKFSTQEIDNIRVAALLHDMENLEITAKVVRKAVGDLGGESRSGEQHTFHGVDLVHSLGAVLTGAFPLLLNLNDPVPVEELDDASGTHDIPFGARIIKTVQAFDRLTNHQSPERAKDAREAINELRLDSDADHHPAVLHALEQVVLQATTEMPDGAEKEEEPESAEPVGAGI